MRVFVDTNVLISAALYPNGTAARAYHLAASYPNRGIICDQNVEELRRIFFRKFPDKMSALDSFLSTALVTLELIQIPTRSIKSESLVRDEYDRPILRAASVAKVDVLLTGDRDFLEAGIVKPVVMSPAEFIEMTQGF